MKLLASICFAIFFLLVSFSARAEEDAGAPDASDASISSSAVSDGDAGAEGDASLADAAPPTVYFDLPKPTASLKNRRENKHGDDLDYGTERYEPAAFPLIGGDSDIGFQFGAVGTLTHFGSGVKPYLWNMDLSLSASIKSGPTGADIAQQLYLWNFDVPEAFGSKVRLNPTVWYQRTINQAYFGIGNASTPDKPAVINGAPGRYYQFDDHQAMVRELTRVKWHDGWDWMISTQYRYEAPSAYAGSKLAQQVAANQVYGYDNLSVITLGGGLVYDTRDNEFFPRRGSFWQIGLRYVQGVPFESQVRYGAFGAMIAQYIPIGGPFVIAVRGVVDAEAGNVPFFDLYTGGPFGTTEMIGGAYSVRGVPDGRYSGPLKAYGNLELRAMLVDFKLLKQSFHLGGDLLFDTGRLWSDYTFTNKADADGIGLKWGAGVGGYLIWGQAAVFRAEVAYSPDAVSENPSLPLGIYVADSVMF
ncbi:MAG: BamA/TamA family outer membrane protein [Polyangiaceae bacterium]